MIYEYTKTDYDEEAFFDWRVFGKNYEIEIVKNGRQYYARLCPLENSYRLTLKRREDKKTIIELRFRNTSLNDALVRAEYYIMEYAE